MKYSARRWQAKHLENRRYAEKAVRRHYIAKTLEKAFIRQYIKKKQRHKVKKISCNSNRKDNVVKLK